MELLQIIKIAFKEIKSNKLRSFLTILGTAIGTASVILFVTISIGTRETMYSEMKSAGADMITAYINSTDENKQIKYEDMKELSKYSSISHVSPVISGSTQVQYEQKRMDKNVLGIDETYKIINKIRTEKGRFINPVDLENSNKVAVIDNKVAKELFKLDNPVGKYININSIPYKIVGVLEQSQNKYEDSESENIYIPLGNAENLVASKNISTFYVKSKSSDTVNDTIHDIEKFLLGKLGDKEKFYLVNSQQMIEMSSTMDTVLDIMVGAVSSISLFVAGIGIMNMMLVSVTERTKEIGIRKALGAKRKSILTQFIIESFAISLIGSLVGSVIGVLGSSFVLNLMGAKPYIAWHVVIISILFALFMGVVFGITPANKAAKLPPIEALKF